MRPLIILTGPTAVGKTELSVKLAKAVGGEIISADSIQVYKYMDIGSAKISEDEKEGVPHYLIDEFEPDEEFNAAVFKEKASGYINDIISHGNVPIIAGGTGFYIQAVLYDINFTEEEVDSGYRKEMQRLAEEKGVDYLHDMLRDIDEISAEKIHANNVKRVIRALEFYRATGRPISGHNEEQRNRVSPYNFVYFILNDYRDNIYKRIDSRVDKMIEDGLVDEVSAIMKMGYDKSLVSMQGLGYKEICDYLGGQCTLDEAVYKIKRDTRHFAKRQLTWYGREKCVTYINYYDFNYDKEKMLAYMIDILKEKNIIC